MWLDVHSNWKTQYENDLILTLSTHVSAVQTDGSKNFELGAGGSYSIHKSSDGGVSTLGKFMQLHDTSHEPEGHCASPTMLQSVGDGMEELCFVRVLAFTAMQRPWHGGFAFAKPR